MNTNNYVENIRNLYKESLENRSRTVFLDIKILKGEEIDKKISTLSWKSFSKIQKVKKIKEYLVSNRIRTYFVIENAHEFCVKNVVFDVNTQSITSLSISRKKK